jgi:magnesium transporter
MSQNPQTTNAAPRPVATTRAYSGGQLVAEGFTLDEVRKHLGADRHTVVWVDLCSPHHADLKRLAEQLDFHELAVEDALGSHQRPKLDEYRGHQFLVLRPVWLDTMSGKLSESEVDAFVGERVMITIRKDARLLIEPVVALLDGASVLATNGVSFMLYGLIDHIVDDYLAVAKTFGGIYDTIGDGLFDEKPLDPVEQEHWFQIRKSLLRFDQLVKSTCEAVNALIDNDGDGVNGEMHPYFQDVRDHIIYVSECTEVLRVIGATMVDTNLAFRDYQQNLAMKKVTSWAGIIAVPTLITGFYGMNVPYPGENQPSGVVVSTLLSLVTSAVLYVYFKRRGWL